jgi:hypothetical protein
MRLSSTRSTLFALVGVLVAGALFAQAGATNVPNWTVPPYRASSGSGGIQTMVDISDGSIFVAITTCRVFDTRDPVGPYGGPRLIANTTRNFDIDGGPCTGIPAGASAYSMNFGAILPDGAGSFITIWPTGAAQPTSSFMNPIQGTVVANAAIIPASSAGSISIFPNTGVHLYGDINGYFMDSQGDLNDNTTLLLDGNTAGQATITGINRDAVSTSNFMAGVRGIIFTDQNGPSGVLGTASSDTGATYAVRGINDSGSGDSAGVFGTANIDGDAVLTPTAFGYAGVRGEASTFGVLGFAEFGGVAGVLVNSTGTILTQGRLGSSVGTDPSVGAAPPWAVFGFGDIGATGTKFFLDPHPSDASKMIAYVALEGPEAGTYFRGRGKFERGMARISVPEDFRLVTDSEGLTVQVTPIGAMATVGVMSMNLNEIVVHSSRNVEFSYLVQGVRANFRDIQPIRSQSAFVPESSDATMPEWLSAGQKRALVQNGTFKADGSINMETAQRLGWDRVWAERERPTPQPAETTDP